MKTLGLLAVILGITSIAVSTAQAQGQELLTNKSVQNEIKATAEQVRKIDSLARVLAKQRSVELAKLRSMQLSRVELQAKVRDLNGEIHDAQVKFSSEFLKPEQLKRFDQITVQRAGLYAFSTPLVQKRLKLTDRQLAKVTDLRDEAYRRDGAPGVLQENIAKDPEAKKKWAMIENQTMDKIVALMSDEQKATWKDLTGDPFEVTYPSSATP